MAETSFKFGLKDAKIASWTDASNWGTALDIEAVSDLTLTIETVSGELDGDDALVDAHSKVRAGSISLAFGFKALDIWAILTGATQDSNAGDTNHAMTFDTDNQPYFGLCGRVDDTDPPGNDVIFVPKCKLMEGFQLGSSYGNYWTINITARAVRNDSTYGVARVLQYAADTAVAIPPTAIT